MRRAYLRNCIFRGSWQNANFAVADLTNSSFANVDISEANFQKALLACCNFDNAVGFKTNFKDAILDGAYACEANFIEANFESASLIAVFWGADMSRASLNSANVFLMSFVGFVIQLPINPHFFIYSSGDESPERMVFEYNPPEESTHIHESILEIPSLLDNTSLMLLKVYLLIFQDHVMKHPKQRLVVHYFNKKYFISYTNYLENHQEILPYMRNAVCDKMICQ